MPPLPALIQWRAGRSQKTLLHPQNPLGAQVKTADLHAVNEQTYQKPGFRRGRDGDRGGSGFLSTAVMEALATSPNAIVTR